MYKEHDSGWNFIVDPLIKICEDNGIAIYQIKEKFGGLRFYTDSIPKDKVWIQNLISIVEDASEHICEISGNPGKNRVLKGWLKTLSDEEYAKWLVK